VAIDSTPITSAGTLQTALSKDKPGQQVQVTYYRGDLKQTASVTLESQAEEQQQVQNASGGLGIPGFGSSPGFGNSGSGTSPSSG